MIFHFCKNLTPSPNCGTRFLQHIEPAGFYVTPLTNKPACSPLPYPVIYGTTDLQHPLILNLEDDDSCLVWKTILHNQYSKTGKRLSSHLIKLGYDSILIRQHDTYIEAVLLVKN